MKFLVFFLIFSNFLINFSHIYPKILFFYVNKVSNRDLGFYNYFY
ncbi:hypothetical protein HMPREF1552_01746 [Leptotrichia sp. oral taxon 879 str. F0557]|nr:hypothetical protein HMPREF1552_01746 [Leptotrichia sp. oral taxon 879 str. F0557]